MQYVLKLLKDCSCLYYVFRVVVWNIFILICFQHLINTYVGLFAYLFILLLLRLKLLLLSVQKINNSVYSFYTQTFTYAVISYNIYNGNFLVNKSGIIIVNYFERKVKSSKIVFLTMSVGVEFTRNEKHQLFDCCNLNNYTSNNYLIISFDCTKTPKTTIKIYGLLRLQLFSQYFQVNSNFSLIVRLLYYTRSNLVN